MGGSQLCLGRRITIGTLAALRLSMPPEEFAREFMGWWEDPIKDDEGAVTAAQWAETITTDAPTGVSLALNVAPGHTWSTIMVCGDGVMEMVDRRRGHRVAVRPSAATVRPPQHRGDRA